MELTHVPPMLRDGLAGQKRKDRDEDAVDGITGAGDTDPCQPVQRVVSQLLLAS